MEAVRMGYGFARDSKAYNRWANRPKRVKRRSLSEHALEAAIMNIGRMFPDNVTRVTA